MLLTAWRKWRKRVQCFHHSLITGKSWISSILIEEGKRKLFCCTRCQRKWIV